MREGIFKADTIKAVDCTALPWIRSTLPNGDPKGIDYKLLIHENGLPQVQQARYEPHWEEARHRHLEDEILAIVEGELKIEGVVHRAPSVIYISRGKLYGPLIAGADGATLLRIGFNDSVPDSAPVVA